MRATHMDWTGKHRAFIVETFIKNESVTATQRAFRVHFGLGRNDPVPSRNTILLWVTNFRASGSALKRKSTGRPRTARTPENVDAVNLSIQQSPQRSARKHAAALGLSIRSLRRILQKDLQMPSYNMMLVQQQGLDKEDRKNRKHTNASDHIAPPCMKTSDNNKIGIVNLCETKSVKKKKP